MAYSLEDVEGIPSGGKITKFAPEKYDGTTNTTTITGFTKGVGIKSLGQGERGLAMVFYKNENGKELTVELTIYVPKSEAQGKVQLRFFRDTLFSVFGKKDVTVTPSDDWNEVILNLASNFTFPSPVENSAELKVVLNKKGWQTVSNQFPIITSDLLAQKIEFDKNWDKIVYVAENAQPVNMFATDDKPISDLIPTDDKLPF